MKMLVPVVHIVGALVLFASLGVESVAIYTLSRSPILRRGERWARTSVRWQIAAAAVILASGVAMAARLEVFHLAWVNVSLVMLVLIAALAEIVSQSRIGQLRPASVATRIGLALGVLYLMVAKPRIVESLLVMAIALAVGAVVATRTKLAILVSPS